MTKLIKDDSTLENILVLTILIIVLIICVAYFIYFILCFIRMILEWRNHTANYRVAAPNSNTNNENDHTAIVVSI